MPDDDKLTFSSLKSNNPKNVIAKKDRNNRWKNNLIPYKLSHEFTQKEKATIQKALKQLEQASCFKFILRTRQPDYVDIHRLDGCYSYVGKMGGGQLMSLGEGCIYPFIIWHEMMHAIGIEHEHQRPDRDKYIKILYQNVEPGQMINFELLKPYEVELRGIPYDYQSIMHYDGQAFGKPNYITGERLVTMTGITLTDNFSLTKHDIDKLNILGNCVNSNGTKTLHDSTCYDKDEFCPAWKGSGFCTNRFYKKRAHEYCKASCGLCEKEKGKRKIGKKNQNMEPKMMECHDLDERCPVFVKKGFCENNNFYAGAAKILCAKSCALC